VIKKILVFMEPKQSLICSEKPAVCSLCPLYMEHFMITVSLLLLFTFIWILNGPFQKSNISVVIHLPKCKNAQLKGKIQIIVGLSQIVLSHFDFNLTEYIPLCL